MIDTKLDNFKSFNKTLAQEQIDDINEQEQQRAVEEHNQFLHYYRQNICYICKKPYKTISKDTPCVHWLLRECKFKKKDFKSVYEKFDFFSINAFLRWVANEEQYLKNINDMKDEQSENIIIQETIKYKHIEWSFECSNGDFKGHGGSQSNFPHYHFQMRINGQQFINYSDFHIPLSDYDITKIEIIQDDDSQFIHTFGTRGAGMNDAMKVDINKIFNSADFRGDELNGIFHFQSIIQAPDGIDGEFIDEAYEESRKTGKSVAKIMRDKLAGRKDVRIMTIGSPVDSVPEIAKRTEHKKRENTKYKFIGEENKI